jgi:hypothetical protein
LNNNREDRQGLLVHACCFLVCRLAVPGTNFTGTPFHAYRLHKAWSGMHNLSLPTNWSIPPLSSSYTALSVTRNPSHLIKTN